MSSHPLDAMNAEEFLLDAGRRQEYVTPVFETVASSYDRFTRWSSLGMDMTWKRDLITQVRRRIRPDAVILDLATGTGDIAFALAPLVPRGQVIGTDLTPAMVALAEAKRARARRANVKFQIADSMALPFADDTFDAVTASYALRNCGDPRGLLTEVNRVLKPGGHFASLEFFKPANPCWRLALGLGLQLTCSFHGWFWHGRPRSYGYLARSIALFVTGVEWSQSLREMGFTVLEERSWLLGGAFVHVGRKPGLPIASAPPTPQTDRFVRIR